MFAKMLVACSLSAGSVAVVATAAQEWENLANQFLVLSREADSFTLEADFRISAGIVKWTVRGSGNQRRWEVVAAKAGLLLVPKCTEPIEAWLTELLKEGDWPGTIPQLALVSERRARLLARDALLDRTSAPDIEPPTLSEQIEAFRVEADVSQEKLAELVDRNTRTIQRHLSGETKPSPRQIYRYEKEFSKLLNRQVVIKKLS